MEGWLSLLLFAGFLYFMSGSAAAPHVNRSRFRFTKQLDKKTKELDMKRVMTAMCMAALMVTAAAAQMPPMDKGKMPMGKMGKAITVTGCVAAGTDAEHFTLTNGMMTGETTGKSYDLMGGELKGHLGHKVAVTGTMETGMAGKDKMAAKPKMEKEDMGEHKMAKGKMAPAAPHSALHVTSVKMIAATCP